MKETVLDKILTTNFAFNLAKIMFVMIIATTAIHAFTNIPREAAFTLTFLTFLLYSFIYHYKAQKALSLIDEYNNAVNAVEHYKKISHDYEKEIKTLGGERETHLKKIETLSEERQTYSKQIETLGGKVTTLEHENNTYKERVSKYQNENTTLKNALNEFKKESQALQDVQSELQTYKEKYRSAAATVSALKSKINKIESV